MDQNGLPIQMLGDLTHPVMWLKWITFDVFWKQFPSMLFNSAVLHIVGCEIKTNSKAKEKLWTSPPFTARAMSDWHVPLCRTELYHYVGLTCTIMSDWHVPLRRTDTYHYVWLTCTIMSDWHVPLCLTDMYHYDGLTCTFMSDWHVPLCRTDMYRYVGLTCPIMLDWHVPLCWTNTYRIIIAFYFACRLTT